MTQSAARFWISSDRWWTFPEFTLCICACKHTVSWCLSNNQGDWWKALTQKLTSRKPSLPTLMFLLTPPTFVLHFSVFFRIMFHLVSATSTALTLFLFSHRLRAKGKWRILSVQTPMLQKAFNSTNWTHTQQSCQAKLLSHVKDQWGGRKMQTPLLSVYANRRGKRGEKNRVIEQNREEIVLWCKQRKPKLWGLSSKPNQWFQCALAWSL